MQRILERINYAIKRTKEFEKTNGIIEIQNIEINEEKEEITINYDYYDDFEDEYCSPNHKSKSFTIKGKVAENDSLFKIYKDYLYAKEDIEARKKKESDTRLELDSSIKEREALKNAYEMGNGNPTIKKMLDQMNKKIDELSAEYEKRAEFLIQNERNIENWENQLKFWKNQSKLQV